MKKLITLLLLYFASISFSYATTWVKLHEQSSEKLLLDKQSVLQAENLKRAWVKIEYMAPQNNPETIDKTFNLSKLLWFFDCPAQKAATSQVFQYLNNELVYSATIDPKSAEFIEPVPETHIDIAMRYVCKAEKAIIANKVTTSDTEKLKKTIINPESSVKKAESAQAPVVEKPVEAVAKAEVRSDKPNAKAGPIAKTTTTKDGGNKPHWTYAGKEGPENWGKLSPEFSTCATGLNQSPINIDTTIHAALKPLKSIQKFPAKDIFNNGHTVQINFRAGNMLVLDNAAYQMKYVQFHSPSENTIRGKSFPLEAHFVHADSKGNFTIIGVMYTEGKANEGLAKLWSQMPNEVGEPVVLKNRVIPSELMPTNRTYYRFSGSLTTPPCSEGVRWLVLKSPITASKEQIDAFKKAVKNDNNRPLQELNGRVIIE
ncbi:MAG: carbonic anhydrase family protein [Methylotenera sp.]|nr:carbonic anhydrase family protein [Methylotenera sp.]